MTSAYAIGCAPGGLELAWHGLEYAALKWPARVLDIGCGTGRMVEWLRTSHGFDAVGLDCSRARFRPGAPLVQARAERLPFASESIDLAMAACSLSLAPSLDALLAECARVLAPGGTLLITDVYARNSWAAATGMIVYDELLERLNANGFEVRLWEDHSEVLRAYVARYIFEHESGESFWGSCTAGRAVARARPGYFLLVARKGKG
jgi:ubiquinone/menaquinone biosynthesis C-methylase UbiE